MRLYRQHSDPSRAHQPPRSLAAPVVEGCLTGLNGIILAYGQTASGKSHSMGVLQGVDIERNDIERPDPEEACRSSPHQTSGRRGAGWNAKSTPSTHGFGEPKGAQIYSHNQADPGMIPRALSRVFDHVQKEPMVSLDAESPADLSAKVTVSLLQIYNEIVQVCARPCPHCSGCVVHRCEPYDSRSCTVHPEACVYGSFHGRAAFAGRS